MDIFEAGFGLYALEPNIVGRAIGEFGGIGIYVGVFAIIRPKTPDAERSTYNGLIGAAWGFANVIGSLVGRASLLAIFISLYLEIPSVEANKLGAVDLYSHFIFGFSRNLIRRKSSDFYP